MTGRKGKTPIRHRNYTQVQRDDYASVMKDSSDAYQREVGMD